MNNVISYWLCRVHDAAIEGPFTLEQLREMYLNASVTLESHICRLGEKQWFRLGDEMSATLPERVVATQLSQNVSYRLTRRLKTGGGGGWTVILFFLGLGLGIGFFPFSILMVPIFLGMAFVVDAKYGKESFCASCGTQVAVTNRQCPHCRSVLVSPSMNS